MANKHSELISEVFCSVLETQAFMFGEPVDLEDLPPRAGEYIKAQMGFAGPLKGTLALAMPEAMCTEVAANVLGLDLDDDEAADSAQDALQELLNVVCGQVLTELAGEEPVFDLTVPEVTAVGDAEWSALLAARDVAPLVVDDEAVLLCLILEE